MIVSICMYVTYYIGVLFTRTDKAVLSSDGQSLTMADGVRKGRGLSEGTFFGLKTVHVHFQWKQVYEVKLNAMLCVLCSSIAKP